MKHLISAAVLAALILCGASAASAEVVQSFEPNYAVEFTVIARHAQDPNYLHAQWKLFRTDYTYAACPVDYYGVLPDFTTEAFLREELKRCRGNFDSGGDQGATDANDSGCE